MNTKPENEQDVIWINDDENDTWDHLWSREPNLDCTIPYIPQSALNETQNELTKALRRISQLQGDCKDYRDERDSFNKEAYQFRVLCNELQTQNEANVAIKSLQNTCREYATEILDLRQKSNDLDELKAQNEKLREALHKAKTEYFNRCYDGNGNVKALTLEDFDRMIDKALKETSEK